MIIQEEISLKERLLAIIIILSLLIVLLYAMALLVEKYMLCKEEKMKYSVFSINCKKI